MAAATNLTSIQRFLRFLGSIQMAMFLIIAWAIGMIWGTIIESKQTAEAARVLVYHTWWFWGIQIGIGVNLIVAVVNRLPLKRHQISFAIVHAGFVLMLAGGLITSMIGYEGQLYVREGAASSELVLWDRQLSLRSGDTVEVIPLPMGSKVEGRTLRQAGGALPGIEVLDYAPKATLSPQLQPVPAGGSPGLAFAIYPQHGAEDDHGHGPELQDFLLAGDARRSAIDLNIFDIGIKRFTDAEAFAEQVEEMKSGSGSFEVLIEGAGTPVPISLVLPDRIGEEVDLGNGIVAQVTDFAEHAMVSGKGIEDVPGGRRNPAAVLYLRKDGVEERHILFSEHPEVPFVTGQGEKPLAARVWLEAPDGAGGKLAFRYLVGPDGSLMLQLEGPQGREAAVPVAEGQRVPMPGYDYAVAVVDYVPSAVEGVAVRHLPPKADGGSSLLQLRLELNGAEDVRWLEFGRPLAVALGGASFNLEFGRKSIPLPFQVKLDDFRIEYHPGSRRESSYASQVKVEALNGEAPSVETEISMNRTLDFLGFRLFQSSYILGRNGGPDTTVLSVNRDPGAGVVYWAFGILIFGIAWYVMGDGRKKRNGAKSASQPENAQ